MSRRRLSEDERTLWTVVTKTIAPLKKRVAVDDEPAAPARSKFHAEPAPAPLKTRSKPVALPAYTPAPPPTPAPSLVPLGRKLKKRVARGAEGIDGRLDLHGLTQAEAHHALLRFVRTGQERGARIVLVITGKGDGSGERGVLKRQVPMWLRLPEFRSHIVGFEAAAHGHGGEGALYVRIKRGN
jgi:DNA-nicking Smr family endonuclease